MKVSDTLKTLYINFQPMLLRYTSRYLPSSAVEDVVHDSFLRYYEKYVLTTKEDEAPKVLLCITHNLCIDYLRHLTINHDYKTKMYAKISLDELLAEQDNDINLLETHQIKQVREMISLLPPRQQELLHLYYGENLKTREIAEQLGLSRRTVENTIYRSLTSLRKKYDGTGK